MQADRPAAGRADLAASATTGPRLGARVLLAEDNPINLEIATALLHALGCCVATAGDGAQAVAAVQADRFDLVLMDCQMPVMDGFEATRRIRQWERSQPGCVPVRVVALTANALAGDRETCLAAGMDDYLTKPIARGGLAEMLARWVDGPLTGSTQAAARRPGEPVEADAPVFDPSVLDSLPMVADGSQPELADEVLGMYARELASWLDEVDAALRLGDHGALLRRMHSLKSSSAQVGALELSAIAARREGELRAGQPASPTWTDELREASARLQACWSRLSTHGPLGRAR